MRATYRKQSVVYQRNYAPHGTTDPTHLAKPDSIHRNFRLSPTASSSQRLLYAFSAWPFTQWYVS